MADAAAEKPASRDWVQEAYQAFVANADGLAPTDPVKAIWEHFRRNASPELKARCMWEGKTPAKCWKFVEAVARKALNGRSGHVDPSVVYAIAMHWFEDVPVDWDAKPKAEQSKPKEKKDGPTTPAPPSAPQPAQNPAEAAPEQKKEEPKAEKPKPKRRPKDRQTFFFDILAGDNGASVG